MTEPAATHTPDTAIPDGLPGLERVCRARGWSLSRAALELGEHAAQVYEWARGRTSPTGRVIARLCHKLGCSADELLGLAPAASTVQALVDEMLAQHDGRKPRAVFDSLVHIDGMPRRLWWRVLVRRDELDLPQIFVVPLGWGPFDSTRLTEDEDISDAAIIAGVGALLEEARVLVRGARPIAFKLEGGVFRGWATVGVQRTDADAAA